MPNKLEKLKLERGKFFDEPGQKVEATILGIDMAFSNGKPYFQGHEVPSGANAFTQGNIFDANAGAWSSFPQMVAPTLYLKKK